jgi:hypothetical protein
MSIVGQSASTYILYSVHFYVCSLIEYSVEGGLLGECFRIGTPNAKVFDILLFIIFVPSIQHGAINRGQNRSVSM